MEGQQLFQMELDSFIGVGAGGGAGKTHEKRAKCHFATAWATWERAGGSVAVFRCVFTLFWWLLA